MKHVLVVLVSIVAATAWAQQPCEAPRVRDTVPLNAAIQQDKAMAQVFLKASQACQMAQSDACDAARLECSNQLASTLKAQVGFDDGAWLRDMLLPYSGLSYPATRQFQAGAMAMDTACNGDTNQLMAASSRRSLQAARRQAILDEYPRYAQWVQDQAKACRDRASIEEARRAQERGEAEKLAAAALAAKAAEELRQKAEAEAKRKAEETARSQADAQKKAQEEGERRAKEAKEQAEREKKTAEERARDEKEAAAAKAKEEREAAERRAKEEREEATARAEKDRERAEKKADEERERAEKKVEEERERAEREKREAKEEREAAERKAKEEAERQKAEAERKAREAEELRLVKVREERKVALRTQKEKLLAQAQEADRRAAEIAGMSFTAEQSQQAALLQTERMQALERSKTLKAQAAEIVIDDSDERTRGSVGILGGAGAGNWTGPTTAIVGAQALFHLGFWGTAPSEGMASGFELRALARFLAAIGPTSVPQAEAVVTARYFFGRFGVGGAVEFRWNQPVAEPTGVNIGFGPALGFAFADTPRTRVMINAKWLPLTQQGFRNAYRFTGDFEVSHEFLTFSISGGSQTQPISPTEGTIVGWYVAAFGGVRFRW